MRDDYQAALLGSALGLLCQSWVMHNVSGGGEGDEQTEVLQEATKCGAGGGGASYKVMEQRIVHAFQTYL